MRVRTVAPTVRYLLFLLFSASLLLVGCDRQAVPAGVTVVDVWAHAGQARERAVLQGQVRRFNAQHPRLLIRLTLIPQGSYNAQVQAAAVSGQLPDLLEFDGPFLYAYVWQGRLQPLGRLLPAKLRADLLPSIVRQGTYHGRLWAVGTFDSGLGLYADGAKLRQAGVRIPTLHHPWSRREFNRVLAKLARHDPDGEVLDLKLDYAGEWYTYAFSPLIESAGGDLIDRHGYHTANGYINAPAAVEAMRTVQSWIRDGRVDPDIDGAAFVRHRVALAFGGHWNYPQYRKVFGNDLLLLPLPDFGHGVKTGQGSWCWAITADSRHPRDAARFLEYLLQPAQILAMSDANGAVPATRAAIARSPLYRPGGPLHLFVQQLDGGYAVPRPRTPAYPVITAAFQRAFDDIRSGGDVQAALNRAARVIDNEIVDNDGYPLIGRALQETRR